jgi:prevent-host-death family protein
MADANSERKDGSVALVESPVESITASDARNNMGDLLDRAIAGDRVVITRHGKRIAALVSARDLEKLEGAA